jgi:tRNA1(Val) A37 N6-methylase TrmN6
MAEEVARDLREWRLPLHRDFRVLDLCAGVGVIGFELAWHLRELQQIDFVEVQTAYQAHWENNVQMVQRPDVRWRFFQQNYASFQCETAESKYDLVVCNPPYFRLGQGKLSPSELKNRSRFMMDSDWDQLWACLARVLKPQGRAAVLQRSLHDHGFDLRQETLSWLGRNSQAKLSLIERQEIRGTDLLWFHKSGSSDF